jgi:hypothetical protein
MRRFRRGGISGLEFTSSGEDSFVAVVVTKLTGALLFILLLAMVIMALLPKAVDLGPAREPGSEVASTQGATWLEIATPGTLPDAVAGRPYVVALAAVGAPGPLRWSATGKMPGWLSLDESSGRLSGTPTAAGEEPLMVSFEVTDGSQKASKTARLVVLPSSTSGPAGARWKPRWPSAAWRTWLEQGVGFLVLWLVHLLGMNVLTSLEQQALVSDQLSVAGLALSTEGRSTAAGPHEPTAIGRRFAFYRLFVRLATLSAAIGLAVWLVKARQG